MFFKSPKCLGGKICFIGQKGISFVDGSRDTQFELCTSIFEHKGRFFFANDKGQICELLSLKSGEIRVLYERGGPVFCDLVVDLEGECFCFGSRTNHVTCVKIPP